MNLSLKEEYEYNLNNHQMRYIDAIYSQLNSYKYNFDFSKFGKFVLERYKFIDNLMASELYDFILESFKLNKNKKIANHIKSFLFDKKDEFQKLFNYIIANGFSVSYPQFEHFYLGIKNSSNHIKSNYICVYISPITDMLDTKVNQKNKASTTLTWSFFP